MPTPIKTDEDWLYPYGGNDYLERTQWNPIYSWGAGGWDLGSAPLVMVLFAKSKQTGYFGIQTYVEGDIHTEWYETEDDRNAKCDEIAEWYWRHGGVQGPAMLDDWPEGELPEEYKGPFSWSRIPDTTRPPATPDEELQVEAHLDAEASREEGEYEGRGKALEWGGEDIPS